MKRIPLLFLGVAACLLPAAAAARKTPIVSLYYYVASDPAAPEILKRNARRISIIAPQTFSMDAEGFIMGEVPPEVKQVARENRIAIMPLVTNRRFDQRTMHAVLDDAKFQDRAIRYLLYYAKRDGAVGFQFDYENIHYIYRDKFTAFTVKAARAFHRRGLLLTLAVVGRSRHERDPEKPGGWDNWSGVYDYRKLGRVADFLSIMAYPEHSASGRPGPVGSIPWMEQIVEYTLSQVPRAKISWGIPVYHLHWWREAGQEKWRGRSHKFVDLGGWMGREGVRNEFDETLGSGRLEFTENDANHVIWYEDARSLRAKLELIQRHRLPGFSAWRLGQEDPTSWELLGTEYPVRRFAPHRYRR
jgi:spore germination protein YaaH